VGEEIRWEESAYSPINRYRSWLSSGNQRCDRAKGDTVILHMEFHSWIAKPPSKDPRFLLVGSSGARHFAFASASFEWNARGSRHRHRHRHHYRRRRVIASRISRISPSGVYHKLLVH